MYRSGRGGAAEEVECLQRKLHLQINIAVEKLSVSLCGQKTRQPSAHVVRLFGGNARVKLEKAFIGLGRHEDHQNSNRARGCVSVESQPEREIPSKRSSAVVFAEEEEY